MSITVGSTKKKKLQKVIQYYVDALTSTFSNVVTFANEKITRVHYEYVSSFVISNTS